MTPGIDASNRGPRRSWPISGESCTSTPWHELLRPQQPLSASSGARAATAPGAWRIPPNIRLLPDLRCQCILSFPDFRSDRTGCLFEMIMNLRPPCRCDLTARLTPSGLTGPRDVLEFFAQTSILLQSLALELQRQCSIRLHEPRNKRRSLDGKRPIRNRMNRRGFLTVGTIGLGGLTLADVLRLEARADQKSYAAITAKADSVIHIFLPGGIAHQETFDPKPFAPIEYRGDMGSIPTKIEGERFSETLPQTAQIADKLTVIRSMTHGEAAHERGTHNMFTGYRPSPALQYPEHGKRGLARVRPEEQPAALCVHSQPAQHLRRHWLPELVIFAIFTGP